ncbi:MAG: LysR family transcriptional regulator [Pseudonocardiaceae bacterium]|nr:LysR family transcriptional regulator [Pseudonocardiaceae bacterium]
MLDVRRLRLLYELSRRGTIAAVGEALHSSPSGVSQQIALLEHEVGVRLLDKVGRGVRLTEAGRSLVAHTEAVLARLERAEAELAAFEGEPKGRVRVASFQTATLALLPEALDVLAEHNRLRVELAQVEPEQALPALLAHDFDLVLGEEYPGTPAPVSGELDRVDLCREPIRLATAGGITLAAAATHAWVMEPRGTAAREWATAMCRSAGFEPDVRYESDDLLAHATLAERGHAAAFLPELVWRGRQPSVPLTAVPGGERTIFTSARKGSEQHPAIRAVREALRRTVH